MKITKLQLENFRNHRTLTHKFSSKKPITVLIGPNGKGKTNFLEAIYILSLGKSFRTIIQEDLINWGNDYLRLTCELDANKEQTFLEVFYSHLPIRKKNFKRNEVNLKNSEYLGSLLTVLFHPEDLNMLYLSPSYRRKYINITLSQTDKKYLSALSNYNKVLKHRNALLHQIRDLRFKNQDTTTLEEDLSAWDQELAQFGSHITEKRQKYIDFLSEIVPKIYHQISDKDEKITLTYKAKSKEILASLNERRFLDIKRAKTSIGPHLDDIGFQINQKDISASASRGEYRTLLLAIKLAEIAYIKEKTEHYPILLLDDVFSELDHTRQKHLLSTIKHCQTIITTTEADKLGEISKTSQNIEFVKI